MGRRHSETELAGKLAASLTAPAPHSSRHRREAEASSVFDLAHPRRADSGRHRLRSRPGTRPATALPSLVADAPPEVKIRPLLVVPVVRPASLYVGAQLPRLGSMPGHTAELGYAVRGAPRWGTDAAFGVAIAWVATIAIGVLAATGLPAHVVMRAARGAVFASAPTQWMVAPNPRTATSAVPTPVISRPFVDPGAAAVIPHSTGGQMRPKSAAPAQVRAVVAERPTADSARAISVPGIAREPSSLADDDNPYAAAPASSSAPEPSALTLEDLMRRAVEKESKPRR
jgi:hypothetical protein